MHACARFGSTYRQLTGDLLPALWPVHKDITFTCGGISKWAGVRVSLAPRRTVGAANHCSCGKCQLLSPRGFGGTVIPTGGRVRLRAQGPRSGGIGFVRIRKYLRFKGGGGVETNLRMIWAASAGSGRGWETLISH